MTKNEAVFTKDTAQKTLTVVRSFDAAQEQVWNAWTTKEILDQWWAPKPYKNETKTLDFKIGGMWLYCMISPQGDKHWCRADYTDIQPQHSFSYNSMFCDEDGNQNKNMPAEHWQNNFTGKENKTTVTITLTYKTVEDLETILKMGFKEGFTAGMDNLEEYLSSH